MTYIIMADGQPWLEPTYETFQSRWNLSAAVKLATQLDDLGYENVHLISG